MKNKILYLLLFALSANYSHSQSSDSLQPTVKYKKVFPGIQLGWNKMRLSTWEAGFFLGLTNNSDRETKMMTIFLHGPSLGCELGNYNNAFRVAPKFSYDVYTGFLAGRVSLVDYMNNDMHNLYVSPEAGISFGSMFNLFAGANFPVSENEITEVKTFRLTISINLLLFYLGKSSSGSTQ